MSALNPISAESGSMRATAEAVTIYRRLRSIKTEASRADPFAAHVLACALTAAIIDSQNVCDNVSAALGLDRIALAGLVAEWLPGGATLVPLSIQPTALVIDEEESQLLMLLERFCLDNATTTRWISKIVTRRAMSSRHLWQDLGLINRGELTQLLERWFPQLAMENLDNMKWKKFFYRKICELEGFSLCAAPSCRECNDFDGCFGEERGESALARLAR
jgi:nitrogen fixation protein NifQ